MEPIITVIIPIYNGEKYVKRAVESVITQPESEKLEVLIVDDGSTDSSAEICDALAEKYPNIRVIHKENGGVSRARNLGIERASGKYISFLDCDDWWEPEVFDGKMAEEFAQSNSADVYQFAYREVNEFCTLEKVYRVEEKIEHYDKPGFGRYNWVSPCCFLYCREFLNGSGICYPISKNGEDGPFVEMALFCAKTFKCVNRVLFSYWENANSCTHTMGLIETLKEQYKALQQEQHFFAERGISFNGDIAWKIANELPKLCLVEHFDPLDVFVREYCLAVLDQRPNERYCAEIWSRIESWRADPRRTWMKYKIKMGIPINLMRFCKIIPGVNRLANYIYSRAWRGFVPIKGKR